MDIEGRVTYLEETLKKADSSYYEDGSSSLTDEEYDLLKDELRELAPNSSLFDGVGNEGDGSTGSWKKAKHTVFLGSLSKLSPDEVREVAPLECWIRKNVIEGAPRIFLIQEKLDGISIELKYDDGVLVSAITRGDGEKGDLITSNVAKMKGVPDYLDEKRTLLLRGEIILKHSDFRSLNSSEDRFKNPRNAAAGIAKRLDGENSEKLSVVIHELMNAREIGFSSFVDAVSFVEQINRPNDGFEFVKTYTAWDSTLDSWNPKEIAHQVIEVYDSYENRGRSRLDWDIDGLVLKTDEVDPRGNLHTPSNRVALKFKHQSKRSKVLDIEWSMRGGFITPIAVIEPVVLAGATVKRASLHNVQLARKKGIGIGAEVEVSRRNDVIPHIEHVFQTGIELDIPKSCPVCDQPTELDGETLVTCSNASCPSKSLRKLQRWIGVHRCKGIGGAALKSLLDNGVVKTVDDLPDIVRGEHDSRILRIPGFGEGKLNILKDQIGNTIPSTLINVLSAMGFRHASTTTFKKILDKALEKGESVTFDDVYDLVMTDAVFSVQGVGRETASSVRKEMSRRREEANRIISAFSVPPVSRTALASGPLFGKTFCFTGPLETMKRPDAQRLVESKGGKCGGVNKNLTFLVTNDTLSGSGKNSAVKKLNDEGCSIKIIDEKTFLEMVNC